MGRTKSKLNDEQKQDVLNRYENCTSTELAKEYGVARGVITKLWLDNGKQGKSRNKYKFNEDYFEQIDTKDKAYFLGLIASDGCVYNRNKGNSQSWITITLQESDKYILEIFKKYLNFNKPIRTTYSKNTNHKNYVTLQIVGNKIVEDLLKYNITERKTRTYEMILPNGFESHFIRGYFDGDGCITRYTRKNKNWLSDYDITVLTGFEHNIKKFQEYLIEIGINASFVVDNRQKGFGSLKLNNLSDKYCFLKFLYQNHNDLYMIRKKTISDDFINQIESSNYKIHRNAVDNYIKMF